MAPIIGVAHVAYIPNKKVVGLSKLARTVEIFSKRLQTQERLTMQVAKTLMNSLDAKGVAVTIDAAHQCMTMRGIKKERATTVTNYYLQRRSDARSFPSQALLLSDSNGNLTQTDLTLDTSSFNAILKNDIRFYAAEDSAGNKLSYNINGSGNSRGTAMVDTKLDGSGNYQQLQAGLDDYRSQEFPNGSAATINTYTFKITQV